MPGCFVGEKRGPNDVHYHVVLILSRSEELILGTYMG